MKTWTKFFITNILLLLLVGGKLHVSPKTFSAGKISSHKNIEKHSADNNFISISDELQDLDNVIFELDEEELSHTGSFSAFSLTDNFYHLNFNIPNDFIWKKIELRNKILLTLQSKIYILVRNLRI